MATKTPYQNEFQDTPLRTAAEQKVELARRKARKKAIKAQNERRR